METHTTTTEDHEMKDVSILDDISECIDPTMDALNKDEVVNCICQLNEENGLMIQVYTILII